MEKLNMEIKAKCLDPERIEKKLLENNALYIGTDNQVDTYFNVPSGRLKLREGNIEQSLIFYQRPDASEVKGSMVEMTKLERNNGIKPVLQKALGLKIEVVKKRKIFFIDNVKFHIDHVGGLGSFVEIEAIFEGSGDELVAEQLKAQCHHYMEYLGIAPEDLIDRSYSDMLMDMKKK